MSKARAARKPNLGAVVTSATVRFTRVPPRKARIVADLLRGLTVEEAQEQLQLVHRPSAAPVISNLLKSAVANARTGERAEGVDPEELIIGEIFVDGGPMLKRYRPKAFGRANIIRKRMSHITIRLYREA
ncbi:MAG TPA: 50S ribosomal protein L22 [Candidatus Sumerlaeota bacterium]|nr:MAG: 50S ribosomal protein L22 [candidate division BRC1 bacterium ADurb.BinA292]HOE97224.1 50S ribosomal protein L22 [Candidatus Sumerlaeota bacterium]